MKALKGLLKYIGIVLASIVALALILLCIMYFFPSVRIFGVGVVHYNKQLTPSSVVLSEYSNYSSIELNVNSKKINIDIIPSDGENIECGLKLNIFGISTEIVEYTVVKNVAVEDRVLKIYLNVSEPSGWIATSNSRVTVNIPVGYEYSLLTNSKSGDVSIGNTSQTINVSNLFVSTGSGNLNLVNMGESLELDSLNLSTDKGYFDLSSITNINVDNKVKLVANDGRFKFNNLNASLDVTGTGVKIEANNIICDEDGFTVIANNGYFDISKLYSPTGAENTIITENTSLNIGEITGKTGIVTEYGDISINTLNDYTMIENTNGRVAVETAKDTILVQTVMGDISVDEYLKSGKFESERGNINVNSTSNYVDGYVTEIINVDGNVTINNKINLLLITTTGRSKVDVEFEIIKDDFVDLTKVFQHTIKASKAGSCLVTIPTDKSPHFKFMARGDISGEITGFSASDYSNVHSSDQYQYYPSADDQDLCLNSCSFWFEGKIQFRGNA